MRNWINQALWTLSVIVCAVSVRSGKNSFVAKLANIIRQVRKTTIQILVVMVFSLIPLGASAITIQNSQEGLVLGNCQLWVFVHTAGNQIQVGVRDYSLGGFAEAKALHLQDLSGTERDLTPSADPSRDWSTANIELTCGFASGSVTNLQSNYVAGQTRSGYNSFYASFSYNGSTYTMSVTATGQAAIATTVNSAPTANAGTDQTSVASAAPVTLDGSGSTDQDGDTLTYAWTQTSGTTMTLSSTTADKPTFTAPTLNIGDAAATLVFSLTVNDGTVDSTADTVSITVNPETASAASEFAAKEDAIRSVITDDARRSLSSTLASNTRLARDARERFLTSREQMQSDGAGLASCNNEALDVDGTAVASAGQIATQGNFFAQTCNFEGTQVRLVSGDFDVQRDGDTGSTTATINGKVAWEQMLSEQTMLGYYLGGEVARSNIRGSFTGTQRKYGVSVGGYFVHALQENLFLDGFASLGVGRNDLKMADDILDLTSDYTTQTTTLGAAVSGVIEQTGYDILPELSVTYGKTTIGNVGFTGVAYGLTDDTLSLDAGSLSTATIMFRPEFRVPMDGLAASESRSVFSFAPRVMCERVKVASTTNNCGSGAELGISSSSSNGLTSLNTTIIADRVGNSTRRSLQFNLQHKF